MKISGTKYDLNLQLFGQAREEDDVSDILEEPDEPEVKEKAATPTNVADPMAAPIDDILEDPEEEEPEEKEVEEPEKEEAPAETKIEYTLEQIEQWKKDSENKENWQRTNTQKAEELARQAREYQKSKEPDIEKFEYKPTGDEELDKQGQQFADMHNALLERTAKQDAMIEQLVGKVQMSEDTQTLNIHKLEVEKDLGRELTVAEWEEVQAVPTIKEVNETLAKNKKLKSQSSKGQKGSSSSGKLSEAQMEQQAKFNKAGWNITNKDMLSG
jgi:hypothetical protein